MTAAAMRMRIGVLPALVAALLVAAMGIQLGFVRPRLEEVRRLEARHADLLRQVSRMEDQDAQARVLAGSQGRAARNPAERRPATDPVAYIGGLLNRTGLTRLELASGVSEADSGLQSTRSTVRVTGSYGRILDFVRALEQGPPLASVDAVSIEALPGEQGLDGRLSIRIFRPAEGARP